MVVNVEREVIGEGIGMVDDMGKDMVVIKGKVMVDEEIEVDRKRGLCGLDVREDECEMGIEVGRVGEIVVDEFRVKVKIGRGKGCRIL